METCSSGEDFLIKPRKPYTITKQRERWTEEEHNRFLEALKLYGRAWQRIEEHIGTKTAVQIRSHAQKFFTKLEKEASIKGIPVGQTVDIDIPPPRPKRKPSNPYPRKTCLGINSSPKEGKGDTSSMSNSSSSPNKEMTNRSTSEKRNGIKAVEIANKARENGDLSEILTLFQDTPCSSSTVKNGFKSPIVFREFVPLAKEVQAKTTTDKILVNDQEKKETTIPEDCDAELTNMTIGRLKDIDIGSGVNIASAENRSNQMDIEGLSVKKQSLCEHFVEDDNGKDGQSSHADTNSVPCLSNQISAPPDPNTFTLPAFSGTPVDHTNQATPFVYHQLPTFTPPVGLFPNHQDAYKFLFNISSSFSNLILSTLLQNPSAHAAATFAASYWPNFNVERTTDPPPSIFPSAVPGGNDNSTPNLASIAAATVAAATAWWATHGLLPLWHPPSANAFGFGPHPAHTVPTTTASKPQLYQKDTADDEAQTLQEQTQLVPDTDSPEDVLMQRSMSKSSPSSDSEGSKGAERSQGVDFKSQVIIELDSTPETGLHESSSNMRETKQGPHPCTLNRQSSSDIEKVGDTKESELSKLTYPLDSDINSRRSRSSVNYVGESWKEVSEEGRIAFQALFSREVLPQSFSPPPSAANMHFGNRIEHGSFVVDLNSKLHIDTEHDQNREGCVAVKISDDQHDSISSSGMQLKFKAHRTGFKPYKRCSMEATGTGMVREEEKSNKRLHVESKASNL